LLLHKAEMKMDNSSKDQLKKEVNSKKFQGKSKQVQFNKFLTNIQLKKGGLK